MLQGGRCVKAARERDSETIEGFRSPHAKHYLEMWQSGTAGFGLFTSAIEWLWARQAACERDAISLQVEWKKEERVSRCNKTPGKKKHN